jgi:hypothetical protein
MFDINNFLEGYDFLLNKMFQIFELKKKYSTKVLLNLDLKDAYLTFDKHPNGKIEINLRNKQFGGAPVCGVFNDEIDQPLEIFEKNLKEFQEDFLKKKKEEEADITKKGFTELQSITIGLKTYPQIKIIKSTGIIDFRTSKMIKCSWERPIEKSTADKLLKLKKRDLVLTDGDVNFICHKISKIELITNKTSAGTNVCFGMTIEFKNGERK